MEASALTVSEPGGSVDICVDSGIEGVVERALTVTLVAINGKASKLNPCLIYAVRTPFYIMY